MRRESGGEREEERGGREREVVRTCDWQRTFRGGSAGADSGGRQTRQRCESELSPSPHTHCSQ